MAEKRKVPGQNTKTNSNQSNSEEYKRILMEGAKELAASLGFGLLTGGTAISQADARLADAKLKRRMARYLSKYPNTRYTGPEQTLSDADIAREKADLESAKSKTKQLEQKYKNSGGSLEEHQPLDQRYREDKYIEILKNRGENWKEEQRVNSLNALPEEAGSLENVMGDLGRVGLIAGPLSVAAKTGYQLYNVGRNKEKTSSPAPSKKNNGYVSRGGRDVKE